ncbi:MAG: 50S ribosomal protein L10 [Coriobacteriia bacterium]|nr:50S ribosomal protein L10 [Coriobacteriia bacterium]
MPTHLKEQTVSQIKDRFARATAVILVDYRGLSVKELQGLRVKLRESGSELRVYKNTLTEIAMRELAMPDLGSLLEGPSAFTFCYGDPVAPAKALVAYQKDHHALELKGGFIEHAVTDAAGVKALASLPSREELLAKLLGTMINPVGGFVRVLAGPAGAFARVLQSIADQKAAA